ncbi:stage II sporulation protein M [Sphaerisporangium sp. NPDC051011]|uniref:stage II sporulation protein M n=1 Tax=Sphaerisporangium sp. NPDC051011 TaxID=3155792 RepID=UPI0033C652A1
MNRPRAPFQIIRTELRAYLAINALVYGAFLLGMGLAIVFPDLHAARTASFATSDQGALAQTVAANPWIFGTAIFLINVFPTALLLIVLPSLLIPFAGLAVFAVKAIDLGVMLAPVTRESALMLIPHSLTILIEFQAYALVAFGAYLLGKSWLRPTSVGATTRRQAYLRGLSRLGQLALPALALFVIGAVYEVIEIYLLVPRVLNI